MTCCSSINMGVGRADFFQRSQLFLHRSICPPDRLFLERMKNQVPFEFSGKSAGGNRFPKVISRTLQLGSIVDKFQIHTAAHCVNTEGIRIAFEAGVDTIIHGRFVNTEGNLEFDQKLADDMAEKGVQINATLHQGRDRIWQLQSKDESELTDSEKEEIAVFNNNWEEATGVWPVSYTHLTLPTIA